MTQESFERLRLLAIRHGTKEDVDALHDLRERLNQLLYEASEMRRCQKCGSPTKGEEAFVHGQYWCHPCADAQPSTYPST
ncbi:formylmethanofuran dehydrogenase subunit E [Bradyrhizobium elkanii]|uniref:hypothetical protein n=1 Tax=Bradyrhizobium elkanii TaxID=29448 RepID=UPI002166C2F0|nr:hypothetical protein [Bradyrhizobium elkanii]MCS3691992.1 formylmethanofuran dehydrogenase subunit E [Bradyrhizobium elkanii]